MERVAVVFPGQGSQYVGMGKTIYNDYDIARQVFEEANDLLGFNLSKLCFEGTIYELNKTENMLLALFTVSVAVYRVYMKEIGIVPKIAAGHSLGEYSALTCSGAIKFSDGLRIVKMRSILAQEAAKFGTMTVVNGVHRYAVEDECRKASSENSVAEIACFNSPSQVVIVGHQNAIMQVEDRLIELNAQVTPVIMSPPFHSTLMKHAAEKLRYELERCKFNELEWPVLSNVTGLPYRNVENIPSNLALQMTKPVQWQAIMEYISQLEIDIVVEMGPKAVLSNLIEENGLDIKSVAFGQKDDREALLEFFGVDIAVKEKEIVCKPQRNVSLITKCLVAAISTRNRNWKEDEYQEGVIKAYEKIERIQRNLEKEGRIATIEEKKEAIRMLKLVFDTKKVQAEKQWQRFDRILAITSKEELLHDYIKNEIMR